MRKNLRLLLILVALTLGAGVMWYMNDGQSSMSKNALTDFAIADTSQVDKIFIADVHERTITLERDADSRYWDLNGKYKARKDAVDLLLKTFTRIGVKSTVPEAARDNVIRLLSSGGKKVEIYENGQLSKTYIVGNATQDHTGTYMLLETPEDGRSSEPFITHMEGFTGFLSTRFFTDENDWRYTGVFDYPELDISEVTVQHHESPELSFTIKYNGGNDLKLHSELLQRDVPLFDTLAVKNYLLLYKKVHVETYMSHLTESQEDSLLNTNPAFTLSVLENSGNRKKIDIYYKQPIAGTAQVPDANGNLPKWDESRMYGVVKGSEVTLIQTFVFNALLRPIGAFAPSPNSGAGYQAIAP
ncbi:hypothetical protein [Sanyastnella coralliicola]|uniref:hypothetical protein n=1 Tax=Sanyastnella coralliicola TaxID=3069118 RepID=UPI0027B8F6BC|nr:hypothetical protein [Longitalea sp. SCSIO 12813]